MLSNKSSSNECRTHSSHREGDESDELQEVRQIAELVFGVRREGGCRRSYAASVTTRLSNAPSTEDIGSSAALRVGCSSGAIHFVAPLGPSPLCHRGAAEEIKDHVPKVSVTTRAMFARSMGVLVTGGTVTMSVFDEVRELAREVARTTTKPPAEYKHMIESQKGFFIKRKEQRPEVSFKYWHLGQRPDEGDECMAPPYPHARTGGVSILLRTDGELLVCSTSRYSIGGYYPSASGITNYDDEGHVINLKGGWREAHDDDLTLLDFVDLKTDRNEKRLPDGVTIVDFDYVPVGQVAHCEGLREALLRLRDHVPSEPNKP